VLSFIIIFCFCLTGCRRPPTDQDIEAFINTVRGSQAISFRDTTAKDAIEHIASKALGGIALEKASFQQMVALDRARLFSVKAVQRVVSPRLAELAANPDSTGAIAALLRVKNFPPPDSDTPEAKHQQQSSCLEAYRQLLTHPSVDKLLTLDTPIAAHVFSSISIFDSGLLRQSKILEILPPILDKPMSHFAAEASFVVFRSATLAVGDSDPQLCEVIRLKALGQVRLAQDRLSENEKAVQSRNSPAGVLDYYADLLGTPFGGAELVGKEAPGLAFLWSSDGRIKDLKQLRGKVVVLDFWTTWCAPCIGSFPNIRSLQQRYAHYPVVILGVTSLQGYQLDPRTRQNVNTQGDPSKEFSLMKDFIKDKQVTWPVVFSKSNVINSSYGVTAIPHETIIDPSGRVRYNALRPSEAPSITASKIDGLLKEAKLPLPVEPNQ
ncbi:MAG: TlpA disulfide reductase family protein, partial [Verrucomicrobia bacterium]|nr:TlpA disulfide reductase family protein [Verrucomicrobiota bacterium]